MFATATENSGMPPASGGHGVVLHADTPLSHTQTIQLKAYTLVGGVAS